MVEVQHLQVVTSLPAELRSLFLQQEQRVVIHLLVGHARTAEQRLLRLHTHQQETECCTQFGQLLLTQSSIAVCPPRISIHSQDRLIRSGPQVNPVGALAIPSQVGTHRLMEQGIHMHLVLLIQSRLISLCMRFM